MAVIVEKMLVNGDGVDIGPQAVAVAMDQALGQAPDAQGGFGFAEPELVVLVGVLVVKGNGKAGMESDAEGQLLLVQVLHRQGMVEGVIFQGKDGHQPEVIGEARQGFFIRAQLQHHAGFRLLHQGVLHQPGKAVLAGFIDTALGGNLSVHHLAGMGEQDGGVVAPNGGVCLPDVLRAVALANRALYLGTPGGDGDLQVLVFNCVFHSSLLVYFCGFFMMGLIDMLQ